MLKIQWLPVGNQPRADGIRLMVLNGVLSIFCSVSFLGTLLAVSSYNAFQQLHGSSPSAEMPFPFPVLFLIYTGLFLGAWYWFGRRLPSTGRARLLTAVIGAGSLLGLGLVGYLGTAAAAIANEVNPEQMPIGSVVVLSAVSTLIVLAGCSCIGVILWSGSRSPGQSKPRV